MSVVVATHDRARLLPRLIAALEVQEGVGQFEVVVVDDASNDDTWAELERLRATTSLELVPLRLDRNSGPATARNAGWRRARAPLVAFTDDDCVPQPGWLQSLVLALEHADLVQGVTLPNPDQHANLGPFAHTMQVLGENGFYETCNMGYRRDVLERVGGFDERFRFPYGEDVDLAWRAIANGASTGFEPGAVVHHDIRRGTVRSHLDDLRRRRGVVLLVASHPEMRSRLHRGVFFRRSHPPALLALAGFVVAATARSVPFGARAALAVALALPYTRSQRGHGLATRQSLDDVPLSLASDLTEIALLAAESARRRTLVL